MTLDTSEFFPRWLQDLKRFQILKSQIYLYGNIYDCYYFPVNHHEAQSPGDLKWARFGSIKQLLIKYLTNESYELICHYDVVDLLEVHDFTPPPAQEEADKNKAAPERLTRETILKFLSDSDERAARYFSGRNIEQAETRLGDMISFFRYMLAGREKLFAGIISFSSRFTPNPNALSEEESRSFIKLARAASEARIFPERNGKRNILILICDKLSDIPTWMLLENPLTQGIELFKPDREERERFFSVQAKRFFIEGRETETQAVERVFPDLTEGLANHELENLIALSHQEKIHLNDFRSLVDLYRYGVRENFWENLSPQKVRDAEAELGRRVFGQDRAIEKSVDIIRRAKLGLHSIEQSRPKNRPKGVLFFAGPTGVGKTELAKSLAELIFSAEDAVIRLDMSEYNDSNSDVKLIGSPPGYVGYEEGGQLTRRMKEKPFSIVLFDEIEKAHPAVFDKFLQILDDGRLTDGKGETVYFSESLIIFTSNLGIYRVNEEGRRELNVRYEDPPEIVADKIMGEIQNFFNFSLNRPEILNRFGDNFVVFDFIRSPVDELILRKNLDTIQKNLLKQKQIRFSYDDDFVKNFLKHYVSDNLMNGGRGIVNRVETHVKNGLANFLFEKDSIEGVSFRITIDTKQKNEDGLPPVVFE